MCDCFFMVGFYWIFVKVIARQLKKYYGDLQDAIGRFYLRTTFCNWMRRFSDTHSKLLIY